MSDPQHHTPEEPVDPNHAGGDAPQPPPSPSPELDYHAPGATPVSSPLAYPPDEPMPYVSLVQQDPGWIVPIGVISVVFGIGGILGAAWAMIAPFVMPAFMRSIGPNPGTDAAYRMMEETATWTAIAAGISLLCAALLLAGGVGILRHRRWAPALCRVWAVVRMVSVLIATVVGYYIQRDMFDDMQQRQGANMMVTSMQNMQLAGMCFGILWGWALPIFMLIWFGRGKVKADVAGWS